MASVDSIDSQDTGFLKEYPYKVEALLLANTTTLYTGRASKHRYIILVTPIVKLRKLVAVIRTKPLKEVERNTTKRVLKNILTVERRYILELILLISLLLRIFRTNIR